MRAVARKTPKYLLFKTRHHFFGVVRDHLDQNHFATTGLATHFRLTLRVRSQSFLGQARVASISTIRRQHHSGKRRDQDGFAVNTAARE
jgi:hypothetical protein